MSFARHYYPTHILSLTQFLFKSSNWELISLMIYLPTTIKPRSDFLFSGNVQAILYIKVTGRSVCLSVCPGSFRALPGPFCFFLGFVLCVS
jgi:hypothetical protein